jgi:drug/metabolite transporter (DMT)-like permease
MTLAGLVFTPWLFKYIRQVKRSDLPWMLAVGIIGNGIPAFLFTNAQLFLNSSITGALNALTPLFTLLIGILFLGAKTGRLQIAGVLMGLAGALVLILSKDGGQNGNEQTSYAALVVLATICYGTSVNIIKNRLSHYKPLITAAFPLAFAALLSFPILQFSLDKTPPVAEWWWTSSFFAVLVLAVLGTAVSLIFFNRLIQLTDAVFASSVTYLIPVVAMLWGGMDGEIISLSQIFGMLVILFGIYLANRKSKKPQ